MRQDFDTQIQSALGADLSNNSSISKQNRARLRSCFAVSELATASIAAAACELAALTGADEVALDRRLASLWFGTSLSPIGWDLPPVWDDIAGVYKTSDGWIRLHTNAPHHRAAALAALSCAATKPAVREAVSGWTATALETAIVEQRGAAAEMRSIEAWRRHPQGKAVSEAPLITWHRTGTGARPIALDEVKVLDLTRVIAGPVATRFLAGFGAQVLRIDPPWWNEPSVEPEVTLGKHRAGLDLTTPEDRLAFDTLLANADVLVHGYRPGALARLGYSREVLVQRAPHLIDVSLNAYGWTGPWSERRGFDSLVQMSCGIAACGMTAAKAAHPVPLPVQALDHATGYLMAAAVLRALRRRNETGEIAGARLSLAGTANLLINAGAGEITGSPIDAKATDFEETKENTSWGPAQRLIFPIKLDGQGPTWPRPAGKLRIDPADWPTHP